MLRKDAEHKIIREWMNLPETKRQSEHQAAQFALKMKRKYPFDYAGGDRYQKIRRMMLRHYKRLPPRQNDNGLGRLLDGMPRSA